MPISLKKTQIQNHYQAKFRDTVRLNSTKQRELNKYKSLNMIHHINMTNNKKAIT